MRTLFVLVLLSFANLANAAQTPIACRIFANTKLVFDKVLQFEKDPIVLKDLDQFIIQIESRDSRNFTLNCLDRYAEIRSYAEGSLTRPEDRLALVVWKRTGLLEVECVLAKH